MVTAATARSQNHTLAVTVVNVPVTRKQSRAIPLLLPRRPLPVHHVRWELEFSKLVAAAGPGPGRGLGGRHLPQPQCQSGGGTGAEAAWAVQIQVGSN